jgi:streptogramin lyase
MTLVLALATSGAACSSGGAAAGASTAGLTGIVSSEAEGPMEGVLVSAKAGTVTVTVVTDREGRYAFPAERLTPNTYELKVRAAGYDLEGPQQVELSSGAGATRDLRLRKVDQFALAKQLMNAEWLTSFPGPPEAKQFAINCNHCHSLEVPAVSPHTAAEWVPVLDRMNYANGASIQHSFRNPNHPDYAAYWGEYASQVTQRTLPANTDEEGTVAVSPERAAQSAFLASINLSEDPELNGWKYPLKTYPRPSGAETRVVMTQYDLPRSQSQPHDAVVDKDGMVWYLDFNDNYFGRLNPATGEVREWPIPAIKPFPPFGPGGLDVKLDPEGNPWFAMMRQNAIVKFDKKTERLTMYHTPAPHNTLNNRITMLTTPSPQGKVWWVTVGTSRKAWVHGLDIKSGEIKSIEVPAFIYGLEAAPDGNLFFFSLSDGVIGEVDTTTGETTLHKPPTPNSGPRRGEIAADGKVWFAQFRAGRIGMFDRATSVIKEWVLDVPYADPYDVVLDRHGDVWAAGMLTDYVFRLNPDTGQITKYLAPTVNMNVRRIDVDGGERPSVWIGENHHGRILRVEPLD